jgi:hypothetical protein
MEQAGIYPSPLQRPTFVQCPLVSGFTTARLYSPYDFSGSTPVPITGDHTCAAILENTGDTQAAVVINQTGTEWYLGTRTVLAAGTIQPGGRITVAFTPTQPYIEVACTFFGPAEMRMQLTSQMQWSVLGFRKDDVMYPQSLWAANYSAFPPVP